MVVADLVKLVNQSTKFDPFFALRVCVVCVCVSVVFLPVRGRSVETTDVIITGPDFHFVVLSIDQTRDFRQVFSLGRPYVRLLVARKCPPASGPSACPVVSVDVSPVRARVGAVRA